MEISQKPSCLRAQGGCMALYDDIIQSSVIINQSKGNRKIEKQRERIKMPN